MRRLIIEIVVIVVFSIILALFFNYLDPEGINLLENEKNQELVEDDELFNDSDIGLDLNNKNDSIQNENGKNQSKMSTDTLISKKSESEEQLPEKTQSDNKSNELDNNSNEPKVVNYEQMKRISKDNSFIIIDARSPELYEQDKIGDAINIFPFAENQDDIVEKIFQIPYGKKIVVYCDGGNCDASHQVAEMLIQFDYKNIYLYTGGWEEWTNKRVNS